MKFKNRITGSIITTDNEAVIEQMQKSLTFAEINENKNYTKQEVKEVEPEMEQSKEDKKKVK